MAKNRPGQGRPRVPSALKIARGTDKDHRKQRGNENEPAQLADKPKCPSYMDDVAKAEWKRICKTLEGMNILSKSYQQALEMYVRSWSNYRSAMDKVDTIGQALVRKNAVTGQTEIVRNPFSVEAHKYADECYKWLTEFGLTPSAKTRVMSDNKDSEPSDFAKFMAGAKGG